MAYLASASSSSSSPIPYVLHGNVGPAAYGEPPLQILEVRLPRANAVFPLSLRQFFQHSPPFFFHLYVVQILSSLNLRATACHAIARNIAALVAHLAAGNTHVNLHIVAIIDYIQRQRQSRRNVEESMILDEVPSERGSGAPEMEELELGEEEELGDCSICLDQLEFHGHGGSGSQSAGKKMKVIKIRCGHVYHESCILTWLSNKNSCPLCRAPLLFQH